MKNTGAKLWVMLISLPFMLVTFIVLAQIIGRAFIGGEAVDTINRLSLLLGLIAILSVLLIPVWLSKIAKSIINVSREQLLPKDSGKVTVKSKVKPRKD